MYIFFFEFFYIRMDYYYLHDMMLNTVRVY